MNKFTLTLCLALISLSLTAQKVTISGNKFKVSGKEIFFNGVNTAWQPQSDWSLDYLGRNFNSQWWNNEFQRYVNNKINLARIWVHCSGNFSPSLNGDGLVTGASAKFWDHMDKLVAISRQKKVYIMPTFWSFDMVKDTPGWSSQYKQYRQIINDSNKTRWYIEYFLIPFLKRYENEPYVMGYDICNEPEHMWRDANCGKLNRNNVVRFAAMVAAAINKHSSKPVTIGSMWIIYNSNKFTGTWEKHMGNNWSNRSLQAQYRNSDAYMDFWSPHWYAWQSTKAPFETTMGNLMDDVRRPTLIGETYGGDVYSGHPHNNTGWKVSMADFYLKCYRNGFAGVCGWKNPHEDDGEGTFGGIANGTKAFFNNYPNLVYPQRSSYRSENKPVSETAYIQAESYAEMSGVETKDCSDGGKEITNISVGDWISFNNIDIPTSGLYTIDYRVASPHGGMLQLEQAGGAKVYGSANIPATGDWENWTYASHQVTLSAGKQDFAVKALKAGWSINWWAFTLGKKSSLLNTEPIAKGELIKVYPNPAQSYLKIDLPDNKPSLLRIFSIAGMQLSQKQLKGSIRLQLEDVGMKKGMYIIQIESSRGVVRQKVLVD